jgi:transposase
VAFDQAGQSIAVSVSLSGESLLRTFPLQPESRSDRALLAGALAQTVLELEEQAGQLQQLQEQLALANRQLFGPSSEKKKAPLPAMEEPVLPDTALPDPASAPAHGSAGDNVLPFRFRRGRKPLPQQLPRTRQEYRLPPDAVCPHCQGTLRPLPPEITEQMIVIPARYEVIEHVRHKALCRCCDAFMAAPMPRQMVEGSSYGSASFLAYIACNKYQLGMPYYRQEKLFRQSHVPVNRTTMANLMNTCADRCVALWLLLKEELLGQSSIHGDETTIQVLKEPQREAQTKSYMWLYCSAAHATRQVILFDYQETRAGCHPRDFLAGFTGYLQTDGYSGYEVVENVTRVGCMAHMRRKFVEALDPIPEEKRPQALVSQVIGQIALLYRIEEKFAPATAEVRQQARQRFSLPIMNGIKAWLDRHKDKVLPKSLLGKAITYALNQWDSLTVYLGNGELSIDNNIAERAIKDLVLGRKAWLFADRPEGAQTIAVMHSLVQTAVANGLDPYRYLLHVFEVMPTLNTSEELKQLLPWNVRLRPQDVSLELAA